MLNVFDVADVLVEDVKRRFADSIAIVAYYGSYANGTATPRSDLDFFFIPDDLAAFDASLQFIVDGIGFDFWPISWARAERIASFDEPIVSVIADCRVLYSRSPADLARFEGLREKIRSASRPESRDKMLNKAQNLLRDCYLHLHGLGKASAQGDLPKARRSAARLASSAVWCLALANQTYLKKGMGQNAPEVAALRLKPRDLAQLLQAISSSESCAGIVEACESLIERISDLLEREESAASPTAAFADALEGFHEEALGTYNKIWTACERGDRETAFYASLRLQEELESVLEDCEGRGAYEKLGLPSLAEAYDPNDLSSTSRAVSRLEERFRGVLKARGVRLKEFGSVDALRKYLLSR